MLSPRSPRASRSIRLRRPLITSKVGTNCTSWVWIKPSSQLSHHSCPPVTTQLEGAMVSLGQETTTSEDAIEGDTKRLVDEKHTSGQARSRLEAGTRRAAAHEQTLATYHAKIGEHN